MIKIIKQAQFLIHKRAFMLISFFFLHALVNAMLQFYFLSFYSMLQMNLLIKKVFVDFYPHF